MNLTLIAIVSLGGVGVVLSVILFWAARKFKVYEDPRIDDIEAALPGANCGGCGYPGCRNFAETCVASSDFDSLLCPVGGLETMKKVASILGKEAPAVEPKIVVLRCNGSCEHRPRTSIYDGVSTCMVASATYGGETDCSWGCLGLADCVKVCAFDALTMNPQTGLPEVDEEKCTSCGACVKACPKDLFQLRKKGLESRRIFVACRNKDKGSVAMKSCKVSCIGCGKCQKACVFGAIEINNDLAYIDFNACTLCRECVDICPTKAIQAPNVPVSPKKDSNTEN